MELRAIHVGWLRQGLAPAMVAGGVPRKSHIIPPFGTLQASSFAAVGIEIPRSVVR